MEHAPHGAALSPVARPAPACDDRGTDANLFTGSWDFEFGGAAGAALGKRAGCEQLGATVYQLQPGARWADLHVHYANEELIVVVAGTPTVRTLEGERELAVGEVVACPRGPAGAHCLENRSGEVARVLIVSTMTMPEVVAYPERDDVFVMTQPPWEAARSDDRLLRVFHRAEGKPVPPDE